MKLDEAVAALCFSLEQLAQPVSSCCRGCCARHVAPYLTRNTHTHTHTPHTHTHTHTQFHVPHSSVMLKPQLCVSVLGYSDIDTSKVMVKCTYFSIVINKFVCVYQHTHTHTHTHAHTQRVHVFLQGVHLHCGNCTELAKDIAEKVTSVERQLAEGKKDCGGRQTDIT